jgi:hypothetical protein
VVGGGVGGADLCMCGGWGLGGSKRGRLLLLFCERLMLWEQGNPLGSGLPLAPPPPPPARQ